LRPFKSQFFILKVLLHQKYKEMMVFSLRKLDKEFTSDLDLQGHSIQLTVITDFGERYISITNYGHHTARGPPMSVIFCFKRYHTWEAREKQGSEEGWRGGCSPDWNERRKALAAAGGRWGGKA
jgi:hypothetical protein